MATGLFGNKYQQAVDNEAIQRQQLSQTGGLTGWAAITQAMGGLGGELGYQGGQMFGGQTPAQVQQSNYQAVIDSVPDFDPTDPASLQVMSSAMWQAGFYDEGMSFMDRSQDINSANIQNDYIKAKTAAEGAPSLQDTRTQQIIDEADLDAEALKFATGRPTSTLKEKEALLLLLKDNGYGTTDIADVTGKEINAFKGVQIQVDSQEERARKAAEAEKQRVLTATYKPVLEGAAGKDYVASYFLTNPPSGLGNEDRAILAKGIGSAITTYDNTLSTAQGEISPQEASAYYEKVLNVPEVYNPNTKAWKIMPGDDYKWDASKFTEYLDTSFGRKGNSLTKETFKTYLDYDLIIPGVTIVETSRGPGAITAAKLNELRADPSKINSLFN